MTIKHLIIPGGGANFPILLGAMKKLNQEGYWNYDDIKSIHCTSCGSLISLIMILSKNWDDIYEYIINRPWNNVYEITPEMMFGAYMKKGIIDISHFEKSLEPFFSVRDWNINITMKEVYDITNIEINMYVTNFYEMKSEVFNYKTQPNLPILKAVSMSAALPPVVAPTMLNGILYVDGGLLANNPIKQGLEAIDKSEHKDILGFSVNHPHDLYTNITDDSNILQYMSQLLSKLAWRCDPTSSINGGPPKIQNTVEVTFCSVTKTDVWVNLVMSPEYRKERLSAGENYAQLFLNYNKKEK